MNNAFDNGFKNPIVAGSPPPPLGNYGGDSRVYGDNSGATPIEVVQHWGADDITGEPVYPPFYVTTQVRTVEGVPQYFATVGYGMVYEISTPTAPVDGILYHAPANLLTESDPVEDPPVFNATEFIMTAGQALYVKVNILGTGEIGIAEGDAVTIVVAADNEASAFYTPRTGNQDDEGATGAVYYKLVVFTGLDVDGFPTYEKYLTGSHICHSQFLPAILNAKNIEEGDTNIVGVIQEWDTFGRAYLLRPIKGINGTTVTENAGAIEIDGGAGVAHPWKVTYVGETLGVHSWSISDGTVHVCGQGVDIALVAPPDVEGDNGYVVLHITRDSAREVTDAEVIFQAVVLDSDYTDQYRVLAYVNSAATPQVVQHQFEEIRLFEELIVINGTFALQVYEISHRNNYELP